ncbi:MAG: FMN-binding protein [Gudongella sp.]|nr:FMN-binding protein [Gudongella sp.]
MKKNKYVLFLVGTIIIVAILFVFTNTATEEEKRVKVFYPDAKKIELVNDISDDSFISINLPAVKRAYLVDGVLKAYVVSCVGYNGPIDILATIDENELIGIEILEHTESLDYAEGITEDYFLERFNALEVSKYLNLAELDKENPEDIVQVTGATISSQAVVNGVNAAIGAYNYKTNNIQMDRVSDVVPQEMWQKDLNSFAINIPEKSFRINSEEIKDFNQTEMDVTLINTTGTKTDMKVKGPTLSDVLKTYDIELRDYAGIGITGRDGYYTMVDKEKLDVNQVILVWEVDGKALSDEERPVRIALPNELGPYWVKMVSNIDLYDEISPKDIEKVHIFNALTEGIEPYYYEYYGSKDKSIEIGKILSRFDELDLKGFFTMSATDGLVKNETISLVRSRYFIKVEGENAPMNIAPKFKLGMNVKEMTHFSTTKDAVIFPEKMSLIVRTESIDGKEALLLEDVLLTAGMRWDDMIDFTVVSEDEKEIEISHQEMLNSYLVINGDRVDLYTGESLLLENILRIQKR